ncbi:MAG TPA: tubulin-like doman-containing protein, partial [Fimbriiglobus sp.]
LKRVQAVRHPYLLSLDRYDIIEGRLMITMELADCNLWDRFRVWRNQGYVGIPRDELLRFIIESAEVLDLMNDQFGLQHLDIKPQNLFLLHSHVKVADFGQVKDLQGVAAQVTGGITPVYAAPETFDGFVSRFCDQYSLACVYQELLTGQRPFDGTTMQQLLMQHLNQPPNLGPVPGTDRPALTKALAKKSDDRFPSVMAFARALVESGLSVAVPRTVTPVAISSPALAAVAETSARIEVSLADSDVASNILAMTLTGRPAGGSSVVSGFPSGVPSGNGDTPLPSGFPESQPPLISVAPPEETGTGPLRPALVIGLGGVGQQVLRAFRKQIFNRFGNPDRLALVRTLYVDTDAAAIESATKARASVDRLPLSVEATFHAKLNRAGHYLKPRLSGRSLIEGWFDPTLLYRLPRTPVTMGHRVFGRLAYCDHYRAIGQKMLTDLAIALSPEVLAEACMHTGLDLRTNRPRVYVVAGLAGGTGSGMFLDVAYTVRTKLKQIGYANPDVVGVILLPPDGPTGEVSPQVQANVYAALTEINHYANEETVFRANFDDRHGAIADPGPPFSQMIFLPGPAVPTPGGPKSASGITREFTRTAPGLSDILPQNLNRATPALKASGWSSLSRSGLSTIDTPGGPEPKTDDLSTAAGKLLWYDLFTPLGLAADEARAKSPPPAGTIFRTVGTVRFGWPRGDVLARASHTVALVLFDGWVSPDLKRAKGIVPEWAQEQWTRLGLEIEQLTENLREVADRVSNGRIDDLFEAVAEPLVPKGWLARLPDANQITEAIARVAYLIGHPVSGATTATSPVQQAFQEAAAGWQKYFTTDLTTLLPGLVDDPKFRLAGSEEAIRAFLGLVERNTAKAAQQHAEAEKSARSGYDLLMQQVHYQKGMRKATAVEFTAAIKTYPPARYRTIVLRQILDVYSHVKGTLTQLLADLSGLRHKLEAVRTQLATEKLPAPPPVGPRELLPVGCESVKETVKRFIATLTDQDLLQIENRVQAAVEAETGGVYQTCLNSSAGAGGLIKHLQQQTREYLDGRLGEVDLAGMFAHRFPSPPAATHAMISAYQEATPRLVDPGPWSKKEIAVVACPPGAAGDSLRDVAAHSLPPDEPVQTTDLADEVAFYREYPAVPLTALPQLGTAWEAAYKVYPEATQFTPHTRFDVMKWIDVNSG